MPMTLEQLKVEAMQLSPEERADFANWLWISAMPSEEVNAAWDAEIARRVAAMDAGKVEWIPAEQAMAEIHERIRKAKKRRQT
jgi:putative addiction module component (TIGR02574 family)